MGKQEHGKTNSHTRKRSYRSGLLGHVWGGEPKIHSEDDVLTKQKADRGCSVGNTEG